MENFMGGKVGKRGDLFPAVSFFPVLPGYLWVPSIKEALHPSWEPQVSRAAGGCPSRRSACQIRVLPYLFICLTPLRSQPGLDSLLCCSHTGGFALLPPGQPPPVQCPWLGPLAMGQGDRGAAGEGALGRAGHCSQFPWQKFSLELVPSPSVGCSWVLSQLRP